MHRGLIIILIIFFQDIRSQNGIWTWMKGDNLPGQSPNYGTQGIASPTNKPGFTYEGTEWKDLSGNFWLYDNYDLWKFNPSTLEWTWIKGPQGVNSYGVYGIQGVSSPSNHPGTRSLCSASWVDNTGNLWLFGGGGYNGYKSDLWKYNILANQWTWVKGDTAGGKPPRFGTQGISNPLNNPGGKYETNATWVDSNNNLWLFGGFGFDSLNNFGYWNTLWKYNIPSNQWTWISGDNYRNAAANYGIKGVSNSTNKPSGRYAYSKWIKNDTLWLFGGESNLGKLNDLWCYSISSDRWTWVNGSNIVEHPGIYVSKCEPSSNRFPYSRNESRSCWKDFNGNFWLFGGNQNSGSFNDLWVYNSNSNKWTWVYGDSITNRSSPNYGSFQIPNPSNNPGGKNGADAWIDGFNNLWLFGGQNGPAYNDLWKYKIDSVCIGLYSRIEEFNRVSNFFISPIPFNESITIQFSLKNNSFIHITLRNLQGQVLKIFKDNSANTDYKIVCNLKELNLVNGLYVIDIKIDHQTVTRKVIKLDK